MRQKGFLNFITSLDNRPRLVVEHAVPPVNQLDGPGDPGSGSRCSLSVCPIQVCECAVLSMSTSTKVESLDLLEGGYQNM